MAEPGKMAEPGEVAARLPDVAALAAALAGTGYLAAEPLTTALFLSVRMGQPILLEGEPGVGKTEAAKALSTVLDTPLIRLQCYEGLTAAEALYEWNYPRQLLGIRLAESRGEHLRDTDLFGAEYLLELCDISGSMEPYARAMRQLLYCAAGAPRAEVFVFATRLTRLTPVLARSRPGPALAYAGAAAPDWSGGTRIGAAVTEFLDTHGRRGMARGAVLLISDGWETGDASELGRAIERLSQVAYRIVWVNPRTQSPRYRPLVGGMAAVWPYCDAVVSAHRIDALDDLVAALAGTNHIRTSFLASHRLLEA